MELEFAVDPLFKKASADFDEGGAKGRLLNHLSIDGTGRIVFDSSDDIEKVTERASEEHEQEEEGEERDKADKTEILTEKKEEYMKDDSINITTLGAKYCPDL